MVLVISALLEAENMTIVAHKRSPCFCIQSTFWNRTPSWVGVIGATFQ